MTMTTTMEKPAPAGKRHDRAHTISVNTDPENRREDMIGDKAQPKDYYEPQNRAARLARIPVRQIITEQTVPVDVTNPDYEDGYSSLEHEDAITLEAALTDAPGHYVNGTYTTETTGIGYGGAAGNTRRMRYGSPDSVAHSRYGSDLRVVDLDSHGDIASHHYGPHPGGPRR